MRTILVKTTTTIIYIDSYSRDNDKSEVVDYFWVKIAPLGTYRFEIFYNKEGTPMHHNIYIQDRQKLADDQKWAWIILNTENGNGGMHHLDKSDSHIEITACSDQVVQRLREI